jgi:hypothetical protein
MESEIVMNLWIFIQSVGPLHLIYELGVRPYAMIGSDDEKFKLLKELAISDFHFAHRFALPADRYYVKINRRNDVIVSASSGDTMEEGEGVLKGLALVRPDISGKHQLEYFMEALDAVEKNLPTRRLGIDGPQTQMPTVNRGNLLFVVTSVNVDSEGNQIARVEDPRRNLPPSPVANVWMFHDDKAKAIYAVSGRAYMVHGSDSEKTRILKAIAPYDFSLTAAQPIPPEFSAERNDKTGKGLLAVSPDGKYNRELFSGVFQSFEREIPAAVGIDGKMKNRVTVSAGQMMSVATRITERSGNIGDAEPIQLVGSTPPALSKKSFFQRLFGK